MTTITQTWGWQSTAGPAENSNNDLNANLNGQTFTVGTDTTMHEYGSMSMIDGDSDNLLSAAQHPETNAPGNGDRFRTSDGIERQIFEVGIYNNSIYTYKDTTGATKTYEARVVIYQLGNGSLVIRMRDDDRDTAPQDFYLQNVTSITLGTWDGTIYAHSIVTNFDAPPPNVCFVQGTLIETDRGLVAVEDLKTGDLVLTKDNGLQQIRWIGCRQLSGDELREHDRLRPIRICAGSLGHNIPAQDLLVSQQHRVLLKSRVAARLFGSDEVLVAAKQLLAIPGVYIDREISSVQYYHILFDEHQIVYSNGAETESFYTGPMALEAVGEAARAEIYELFPELRNRDYRKPEARLFLNGKSGRNLVQRHLKSTRPLWSNA